MPGNAAVSRRLTYCLLLQVALNSWEYPHCKTNRFCPELFPTNNPNNFPSRPPGPPASQDDRAGPRQVQRSLRQGGRDPG